MDGCDERENRQTDWLRGKGIGVQTGHAPDHLKGVDWVIRTTAMPLGHPEIRSAPVPVHRRGEVLPELLRDRFTVAVSGTHGKTTTTAMIAQILECGYCIGGEVDGLDGTACDGEIMVVEADESDGTVALYHPDISVITNIEYDHMEHHADPAAFEDCFRRLIENTREKVIYCADDPAASRLCAGNPKAIGYGTAIPGPAIPELPLPGLHNRLNALAAALVCRRWKTDEEMGCALQQIRPARRRFERVFDGECTVVSDYAHHPTEIRTLIETAASLFAGRRLLGVFQPHRYTRTRALLHSFPPAFEGLDRLWLLPVYAASEAPLAGGTSDDLFQAFSPEKKKQIFLFQSMRSAWQDVQRQLRAGDVLLVMGAGDIEALAFDAALYLRQQDLELFSAGQSKAE